MRISEITTDIEAIDRLLNQFYVIDNLYTIDNGIINVRGNCVLYKGPPKVNDLKVKFGKVSKDFYCTENELTSLEGSPIEVGAFNCSFNRLESLKGGPKIVRDTFGCNDNKLTSFEGGPEEIGGGFYAYDNPLISLNGLPKSIGSRIGVSYNEKLPLLKLFFVKGLLDLSFFNPTNFAVEDIINKYLGKGKAGALQCAAELTKAGFKNNARL